MFNVATISHETKMKERCKMLAKKIATIVLMLVCLPLVQAMALGASPEPSEKERQEYKQERARTEALRNSLLPGLVNDLKEYEKFADEIQHKWSQRNREYYARLMLQVCGPLSSGNFKDDRRHELARKYALAVLEAPDAIPLRVELEFTGHVITDMYSRNAPKGEDFAQRRKRDVQIRLHAWKRLRDAIDPNWDPKEVLLSPNAVGARMGLPSGMAAESVKDPLLRAKYEAALQTNRQKIERQTEQSRLHGWLKKFPNRAERYIIRAYSIAPFNLKELEQYLDKYMADSKTTKTRILIAVRKNHSLGSGRD